LCPEKAFRPRKSSLRKGKLDSFIGNVKAWLEQDPMFSSVWVYDHLKPMGFTGGYDIVKRYVQTLKAERTKIAYLRFETEPGRQAQVDWAEFQWLLPDGTIRVFYLFAMILGYSRNLYCELVEKCDLTTFLDCHIHAFEFFGGVPAEILYDRMKNVYIRKLAGKTVFNSSLTSLAVHYGFQPLVAPAYAPWMFPIQQRRFLRDISIPGAKAGPTAWGSTMAWFISCAGITAYTSSGSKDRTRSAAGNPCFRWKSILRKTIPIPSIRPRLSRLRWGGRDV
jgi:hypothetical protein